MKWTKIIEWLPNTPNQKDTYPEEGVEVVVSDGKHYDVAWYLRSGEYKWVKTCLRIDTLYDFSDFKPTHWAPIDEL